MDKGLKFSEGKPKLHLLFKQFPRAIKQIVLLSEYGHNKYKEGDEDWQNFSRVKDSETSYIDAELRHLADMYEKNEIDESGYLHKVHKAWNALADLELELRNNE